MDSDVEEYPDEAENGFSNAESAKFARSCAHVIKSDCKLLQIIELKSRFTYFTDFQ